MRKAVREIHSPPPQPKDHNRALDPRLEEDLDIFVELGDGVFYQASYDGTEVAMMTDYPGLLPVSHVSKQETYLPKSIHSFRLTHRTYIMI